MTTCLSKFPNFSLPTEINLLHWMNWCNLHMWICIDAKAFLWAISLHSCSEVNLGQHDLHTVFHSYWFQVQLDSQTTAGSDREIQKRQTVDHWRPERPFVEVCVQWPSTYPPSQSLQPPATYLNASRIRLVSWGPHEALKAWGVWRKGSVIPLTGSHMSLIRTKPRQESNKGWEMLSLMETVERGQSNLELRRFENHWPSEPVK